MDELISVERASKRMQNTSRWFNSHFVSLENGLLWYTHTGIIIIVMQYHLIFSIWMSSLHPPTLLPGDTCHLIWQRLNMLNACKHIKCWWWWCCCYRCHWRCRCRRRYICSKYKLCVLCSVSQSLGNFLVAIVSNLHPVLAACFCLRCI